MYKDNEITALCSFFNIDTDKIKDITLQKRTIFWNIKSPMKKYIDFDTPEMPIPYKY